MRRQIVAHNTAMYSPRPFEETTFEERRRVMAVNLDPIFSPRSGLLPHLRERGWGGSWASQAGEVRSRWTPLRRRHRAADMYTFMAELDEQVAAGRTPDLRQLQHPQRTYGLRLARCAPQVPYALRPDLLVLTQPGRALVRVTD